MERHDYSTARSWGYARDMLAAKWAPAILTALVDGPMHYKELLREVREHYSGEETNSRDGVLHDGILTKTLKVLTENGLLRRHQISGVFPPSVTYSLTTAARELLIAARPLAAWAERHHTTRSAREVTIDLTSKTRWTPQQAVGL